MSRLFLDTTEDLRVGLAPLAGNSLPQWFEFVEESGIRSTARLHEIVNDMLERHGTSIHKIESIFQISGPGSYTGMRVSQGFTKILEFLGKNVHSFFHFQIPLFLGVGQGMWVSKAYKGELFVYEWKGVESKTGLMTLADFEKNYAEDYREKVMNHPHYLYCNSRSSLPLDMPREIVLKFEYTGDLLRAQSISIFAEVERQGLKMPPMYYRPLEKEFNCTAKAVS